MSKIKIISNPYTQSTEFQSWSQSSEKWVAINEAICPNSELLNAELKEGFFPFKARQIIDILIEEYCTESEILEIVFEGTEDEYRELESICTSEKYISKVTPRKSNIYLENARDILPDVINVFKELTPLIEDYTNGREDIQKKLDRFSDASNDVIPICVIGNYSSGKSTFINALVGYELLPSSDEPTTAKIYRITQSEYMDRAKITFDCAGDNVSLQLRSDSYKFIVGSVDNPLVASITTILDELSTSPLSVKLNNILNFINTYANEGETIEISDLIQVEAPFSVDGIWGKTRNKFVIFDTPGSNSASNRKHYDVLKKAMENLTNGLPIFVSEFDSLDSTDNDNLYQYIKSLGKLDNRFTMIIVNKADSASLNREGYTEEYRDRILSLAIPKKLYAGGIYFISSIMGLGSKNGGEFISDHNAEIFEDQCGKYTNPQSRFYKKLYQYDILPAQIKAKLDTLSLQQSNLLYANSGLYAVEQAVGTFADVYSHYNKCHQSEQFLGDVISSTLSEIEAKKAKTKEYRKRVHGQLERDKEKLMQALETESNNYKSLFETNYNNEMNTLYSDIKDIYTKKELLALKKKLMTEKTVEQDVSGKRDQVLDCVRNIPRHLFETMPQDNKGERKKSLRIVGAGAVEDWQNVVEEQSKLRETKKCVKKEASEQVLETVKKRFVEKWTFAQNQLEKRSTEFCSFKTDEFRKELLSLVTESSALSKDQREKIAGIIMEYQPMDYRISADELFDKAKFLHRIFGVVDRLDITKLSKQYNKNMRNEVKSYFDALNTSRLESFNAWRASLVGIICENIIEFNPALYDQWKIIEEENFRIQELEKKICMLQDYTSQISEMMSWKEA